MQTTAAAAPYFLPFVLVICIWVIWSDMARMTIPNRAVLALAGVFVVIGPFVLPFDEYLWRLLNGVIAFVVGGILFQVGLSRLMGIGAGDLKFISAAAPYVPPTAFGLVAVAFSFSLLLIVTFLLHRLLGAIPAIRNLVPGWKSWQRDETTGWRKQKFPMGVPLALTLAYLLIRSALRI